MSATSRRLPLLVAVVAASLAVPAIPVVGAVLDGSSMVARAGAGALDLPDPFDPGIPVGEVREVGHVREGIGASKGSADVNQVASQGRWSARSP